MSEDNGNYMDFAISVSFIQLAMTENKLTTWLYLSIDIFYLAIHVQ